LKTQDADAIMKKLSQPMVLEHPNSKKSPDPLPILDVLKTNIDMENHPLEKVTQL
jgi:hypothetical protein